jgi:hypothetical protein
VAIGLIALMAFTSLVIDYGIFWAARRQAQNSADAAALSGAISLAFDNPLDFTATGPALVNGRAAALANAVWGVQPSVNITNDRTPSDPALPGTSSDIRVLEFCPDTTPDKCVRADVYRTVARSNPLPTFFGRLIGFDTQDVRATAIAQVLSGDESDCLKPWAVADKWDENVRCAQFQGNSCASWAANDTWDLDQTFDKWQRGNPPVLDTSIPSPPGYDVYRAPGTNGPTDPGTGFGLYNADGTIKDYGTLFKIKLGGGSDVISSGWFLPLDMSSFCTASGCPTNSGAQMYTWTITNCVGGVRGVGDTIPVETGNMTGPTGQGVYQAVGQQALSLWQRDPGARWNNTTKEIENSCAPGVCADGRYYATSPRIVPVPLFNVDSYFQAGYTGSNGQVTITNVFGFFILGQSEADGLGLVTGQGTHNDEVYGVMVAAPGLMSGSSTIPPTSSFLQTIRLVR